MPPAEDLIQRAVVHLAADPQPVGDQVVHQLGRSPRRTGRQLRHGPRSGSGGAAPQSQVAHRAAIAVVVVCDPVRQRLGLGQDVAGQQHRPAIFRSSVTAIPGRFTSISGSRPAVGCSRAAAARRRWPARRSARPSAVAAGVGAGLLRRIKLEPVGQRPAARGVRPPRSRPSRSMISPPDSPGHSVTSPGAYTTRRCRAAASRHGSPPSGAARQASLRSRPSGSGSRWSCPRRSGPGRRAPHRPAPRDPGRRARPRSRTAWSAPPCAAPHRGARSPHCSYELYIPLN